MAASSLVFDPAMPNQNQQDINSGENVHNPVVSKILHMVEQCQKSGPDDQVKHLVDIWNEVAENYRQLPRIEPFFLCLFKESCKIILSQRWDNVQHSQRKQMGDAVSRCGERLKSTVKRAQKLSSALLLAIYDPWGESVLSDEYLVSEPMELVLARVENLLAMGKEEKATEICESYFRLQKQLEEGPSKNQKSGAEVTENLVLPSPASPSHARQSKLQAEPDLMPLLELFVILLFRKDRITDIVKATCHCSCHQGVRLVRSVQNSRFPESSALAQVLTHLFLVQDLHFPSTYCCTKELMGLWCWLHQKSPLPEVQDAAKKLIVAHASNSAHFYLFVDMLWEQFGYPLLPLYLELYILGLTTDINHLEAVRSRQSRLLTIELETHIAGVFAKLASLFSGGQEIMARECLLSAFSLEPTPERLLQLDDLHQAVDKGGTVQEPSVDKPKNKCNDINPEGLAFMIQEQMQKKDETTKETPTSNGKERPECRCEGRCSTPTEMEPVCDTENCPFRHPILDHKVPGISLHIMKDLVTVIEGIRHVVMRNPNSWEVLRPICEAHLDIVSRMHLIIKQTHSYEDSADSELDSKTEDEDDENGSILNFEMRSFASEESLMLNSELDMAHPPPPPPRKEAAISKERNRMIRYLTTTGLMAKKRRKKKKHRARKDKEKQADNLPRKKVSKKVKRRTSTPQQTNRPENVVPLQVEAVNSQNFTSVISSDNCHIGLDGQADSLNHKPDLLDNTSQSSLRPINEIQTTVQATVALKKSKPNVVSTPKVLHKVSSKSHVKLKSKCKLSAKHNKQIDKKKKQVKLAKQLIKKHKLINVEVQTDVSLSSNALTGQRLSLITPVPMESITHCPAITDSSFGLNFPSSSEVIPLKASSLLYPPSRTSFAVYVNTITNTMAPRIRILKNPVYNPADCTVSPSVEKSHAAKFSLTPISCAPVVKPKTVKGSVPSNNAIVAPTHTSPEVSKLQRNVLAITTAPTMVGTSAPEATRKEFIVRRIIAAKSASNNSVSLQVKGQTKQPTIKIPITNGAGTPGRKVIPNVLFPVQSNLSPAFAKQLITNSRLVLQTPTKSLPNLIVVQPDNTANTIVKTEAEPVKKKPWQQLQRNPGKYVFQKVSNADTSFIAVSKCVGPTTTTTTSILTGLNAPLPVVNRSNTTLPATSRSNTTIPVISRSNATLPVMSRSNTTLPVTCRSNTILPVVSRSNTTLPVVCRPNTSLPVIGRPSTTQSVVSRTNLLPIKTYAMSQDLRTTIKVEPVDDVFPDSTTMTHDIVAHSNHQLNIQAAREKPLCLVTQSNQVAIQASMGKPMCLVARNSQVKLQPAVDKPMCLVKPKKHLQVAPNILKKSIYSPSPQLLQGNILAQQIKMQPKNPTPVLDKAARSTDSPAKNQQICRNLNFGLVGLVTTVCEPSSPTPLLSSRNPFIGHQTSVPILETSTCSEPKIVQHFQSSIPDSFLLNTMLSNTLVNNSFQEDKAMTVFSPGRMHLSSPLLSASLDQPVDMKVRTTVSSPMPKKRPVKIKTEPGTPKPRKPPVPKKAAKGETKDINSKIIKLEPTFQFNPSIDQLNVSSGISSSLDTLLPSTVQTLAVSMGSTPTTQANTPPVSSQGTKKVVRRKPPTPKPNTGKAPGVSTKSPNLSGKHPNMSAKTSNMSAKVQNVAAKAPSMPRKVSNAPTKAPVTSTRTPIVSSMAFVAATTYTPGTSQAPEINPSFPGANSPVTGINPTGPNSLVSGINLPFLETNCQVPETKPPVPGTNPISRAPGTVPVVDPTPVSGCVTSHPSATPVSSTAFSPATTPVRGTAPLPAKSPISSKAPATSKSVLLTKSAVSAKSPSSSKSHHPAKPKTSVSTNSPAIALPSVKKNASCTSEDVAVMVECITANAAILEQERGRKHSHKHDPVVSSDSPAPKKKKKKSVSEGEISPTSPRDYSVVRVVCDDCGKGLATTYNLKRHMKNVHNKKLPMPPPTSTSTSPASSNPLDSLTSPSFDNSIPQLHIADDEEPFPLYDEQFLQPPLLSPRSMLLEKLAESVSLGSAESVPMVTEAEDNHELSSCDFMQALNLSASCTHDEVDSILRGHRGISDVERDDLQGTPSFQEMYLRSISQPASIFQPEPAGYSDFQGILQKPTDPNTPVVSSCDSTTKQCIPEKLTSREKYLKPPVTGNQKLSMNQVPVIISSKKCVQDVQGNVQEPTVAASPQSLDTSFDSLLTSGAIAMDLFKSDGSFDMVSGEATKCDLNSLPDILEPDDDLKSVLDLSKFEAINEKSSTPNSQSVKSKLKSKLLKPKVSESIVNVRIDQPKAVPSPKKTEVDEMDTLKKLIKSESFCPPNFQNCKFRNVPNEHTILKMEPKPVELDTAYNHDETSSSFSEKLDMQEGVCGVVRTVQSVFFEPVGQVEHDHVNQLERMVEGSNVLDVALSDQLSDIVSSGNPFGFEEEFKHMSGSNVFTAGDSMAEDIFAQEPLQCVENSPQDVPNAPGIPVIEGALQSEVKRQSVLQVSPSDLEMASIRKEVVVVIEKMLNAVNCKSARKAKSRPTPTILEPVSRLQSQASASKVCHVGRGSKVQVRRVKSVLQSDSLVGTKGISATRAMQGSDSERLVQNQRTLAKNRAFPILNNILSPNKSATRVQGARKKSSPCIVPTKQNHPHDVEVEMVLQGILDIIASGENPNHSIQRRTQSNRNVVVDSCLNVKDDSNCIVIDEQSQNASCATSSHFSAADHCVSVKDSLSICSQSNRTSIVYNDTSGFNCDRYEATPSNECLGDNMDIGKQNLDYLSSCCTSSVDSGLYSEQTCERQGTRTDSCDEIDDSVCGSGDPGCVGGDRGDICVKLEKDSDYCEDPAMPMEIHGLKVDTLSSKNGIELAVAVRGSTRIRDSKSHIKRQCLCCVDPVPSPSSSKKCRKNSGSSNGSNGTGVLLPVVPLVAIRNMNSKTNSVPMRKRKRPKVQSKINTRSTPKPQTRSRIVHVNTI